MSRSLSVFLFCCLFSSAALAQEGETWETQQAVWDVTAIKILPNAGEQYLNQLRTTWVAAMDKAKQQGLITNYQILSSVLDNDEGYNLLLIVHYPSLAVLDATKEMRTKWMQLEKDMEKVLPKEKQEQITATVFPKLREIKSEKLMREIKFISK
jgi:hypothetical protein